MIKEAAYIVEKRLNNLQKKIKKKIVIIIRIVQFYCYLKVCNKKGIVNELSLSLERVNLGLQFEVITAASDE